MKLEEGLLPRVVAAVFNFCDCRIEEKIKQPERLQREHEEKKHSEDEHLALYLKYDELLAELVALSWVSIQEKMDLSDSAQRKRDVVHVLLLEEEKMNSFNAYRSPKYSSIIIIPALYYQSMKKIF